MCVERGRKGRREREEKPENIQQGGQRRKGEGKEPGPPLELCDIVDFPLILEVKPYQGNCVGGVEVKEKMRGGMGQ